jgi:diguanylate cyclase (GGDEF)-like protein
LTGVANRALFQDRLEDSLAQGRRDGSMTALLLLDLDRFKEINDRLGHPAGDRLLKEVAYRLTLCARETDTVARLGGDEFALIATRLSEPAGAGVLAEKILDAMGDPIQVDGQNLAAGCSIGIAVAPGDGDDATILFKNADVALYQSKAEGRGVYRFYDVQTHTEARKRRDLEVELRQALRGDRLVIEVQPKIHGLTGELAGVEALVRWKHPERGLISPAEFIPVTEANGLVMELGEWLLKKACWQCAAWQRLGLPAIPVAVNISIAQLREGELPNVVSQALAESGIPPACLELDLTESTVMQDLEHVRAVLIRLQELGVSISIDNFGTGYSCLSSLSRLPVNKLKIDQSFFAALSGDEAGKLLAAAIIASGKGLSMEVIAQGVETARQPEYLALKGCDDLQAYYVSPPIPAEALPSWYQIHLELSRQRRLADRP